MPAPAARNPGNHSVRWRTTSRAAQPGTGVGASQERVAQARSVKSPATCRCRSAGRSGSVISDRAIAEHPVQLGVTLVDANLHAAAQPRVAAFEAVDQRLRPQPGTAVTQILEPQRFQGDAVGIALEREGLHDTVRPNVVEAAVEPVLRAVVHRDVLPAAAGTRVPVLDP